jgi:hypothetical protein
MFSRNNKRAHVLRVVEWSLRVEVILPLPLLVTHTQQVCRKVQGIKWQHLLGGTVCLGAGVQAGQVFEIAVKLLYFLEELPNRHSIWLFEGVGDIIFPRLT